MTKRNVELKRQRILEKLKKMEQAGILNSPIVTTNQAILYTLFKIEDRLEEISNSFKRQLGGKK